jgi:hypothetical protein
MKRLANLIASILIFQSLYSQGVSERLSFFSKESIIGYIQPLVDAFGANLNSGLYHSASMSKLFGFYIGVKGMFLFVPSSMENFTAELGPDFEPSSVQTATVLGDKGASVFHKVAGDISLPGGLNLSIVPLFIPQFSFSTMNSEILIRYVPSFKLSDDIGSINLFGIGIAHSLSQYIPLFPIDIAVQGVYQKFKAGDYLDASALNFNIHASKSFILFTIYAGIGYETFSADINYLYKPPYLNVSEDVSINIKGSNNFRLTAGFKLGLALFDLNIDYSIGSVNVLSAGFGFSF